MPLLVMLVMSIASIGCSSDDNDDPVLDSGTMVSGTYTGQLKYGDEVVSDAYVVTIARISSSVASVNAKFFSEAVNFNVALSNGQYVLTNSNYPNISIHVSGNTLILSYLTTSNYMFGFTGIKG